MFDLINDGDSTLRNPWPVFNGRSNMCLTHTYSVRVDVERVVATKALHPTSHDRIIRRSRTKCSVPKLVE